MCARLCSQAESNWSGYWLLTHIDTQSSTDSGCVSCVYMFHFGQTLRAGLHAHWFRYIFLSLLLLWFSEENAWIRLPTCCFPPDVIPASVSVRLQPACVCWWSHVCYMLFFPLQLKDLNSWIFNGTFIMLTVNVCGLKRPVIQSEDGKLRTTWLGLPSSWNGKWCSGTFRMCHASSLLCTVVLRSQGGWGTQIRQESFLVVPPWSVSWSPDKAGAQAKTIRPHRQISLQ